MCGWMCLPFGNMSATSLYFVSWCSWVGEVVLLHGPVASACADIQDLLAFGQWGLLWFYCFWVYVYTLGSSSGAW